MRRLSAGSLLVLALAGCGGDSSSGPETLTAVEWRREANAICRDIGRDVRAVPPAETLDEVFAFTSAVSPLWKREEERLRALAAPPELATAAEELADALAEVNVSLLEIHIARQRNDGARLAAGVTRGEVAAQGVERRSRDLGLPACAAQRIP